MTKPARPVIVFAVPDFEPTIGGTTRQTANQARALAARGHDVVVLTQRLVRDWPRREQRDGITVVRVGPASRTAVAMKCFVVAAAWWFLRNRARIAVVQVLMYPDLVLSAAAGGLGRRSVMTWAGHGDASDTLGASGNRARAVLGRLRRRAFRHTVQVALTASIASELDALASGRRIVTIPTPVDLDHFHPPDAALRARARLQLGAGGDTFVVLYAGHLRALKRVELLVRAFAELAGDGIDTRLVIVGGSRADLDDTSEMIRAEVARLGIGERVDLVDAVDDVRPYLHAADVFVLPSSREGLSNSILEALACGVPCIAPPSAGGDQVLDTTCGIVPPDNSPEELHRALARLAGDLAERQRLAAGAAERAQQFAIGPVIDAYEAIYSGLAADAR